MMASLPPAEVSTFHSPFLFCPPKTFSCFSCLKIESLLTEIVKFIKDAIKNSTTSCIVCNKPHPLELLKPTVCDDLLCNFQYVS